MKKTMLNLNLVMIMVFASLTLMAQFSGATTVTPFFGSCTAIFMVLQLFCRREK